MLEMRRKVENVENEAERASLACRQSRGAYMTHMTENKSHWIPTWITPATVSRQSKALWSRAR
jgi:hypothetical protein